MKSTAGLTTTRLVFCCVAGLFALMPAFAVAQPEQVPESLRAAVDVAVGKVRPALVRIHVVETYYREGREMKYEASGSGVIITEQGHVITNHHVAGHAKQIKCTLSNKEEVGAELIGSDPLTDIAVIQLEGKDGQAFPVGVFGDSDAVRTGDHVLAMGSPLSLSQSVTLGIVSNTEMILPQWMNRYGGLEQDGEDVGALVRWLGHDAQIYGGNSGGPLVNLKGEIIAINEIKMGLGGAIPGNLAKEVADELMATGTVKRAWLGIEVQPRLKHDTRERGVLVGGVIKESPAEAGGLQSGDLLVSLGGEAVDVRFAEQLPGFNRLAAGLAIGAPIAAVVLRENQELSLDIRPTKREPYQPKQYELKEWGVTVRDLSFMMAKEMKRKNTDGVLITSVRPGGPAGAAKPPIQPRDVLVEAGGKALSSVNDLREATKAIIEGAEDPVDTLTAFERKTGKLVTVVSVGISDLRDPGLEVKKAWLPVDTQVITRDIAGHLEGDLRGFRVTQVYKGTTAEAAGLEVGDLILAVDGEKMTASAPEHYEELSAWIRQYKVGTTAELSIQRDGEAKAVSVELVRAPMLEREMKKYRDDNFEFTVRDVSFFDRAKEEWKDERRGVLVDQVKSGGWASLGQLSGSDLILTVDDEETPDVAAMKKIMERVAEERPDTLVFKVLRGIHTFYVELEPKWDNG